MARAPGFQAFDVTLGASHLRVMLSQRKSGHRVFEGIAPTHGTPIDDTKCPPLVFDVALDARLVAEGDM
jgi:hypothetical protein